MNQHYSQQLFQTTQNVQQPYPLRYRSLPISQHLFYQLFDLLLSSLSIHSGIKGEQIERGEGETEAASTRQTFLRLGVFA